jgi:hypothetical protein
MMVVAMSRKQGGVPESKEQRQPRGGQQKAGEMESHD